MKRLQCLAAVAAASLVLLMIGCAKEPVREMAAAKAAVDSAKTAQADVYLPDQFASVSETLNAALSDIEKQKAGSPMKRNYEKDKQSLMSVATTASDLKAKVGAEKTRVQAGVESSIARASASVEEIKASLKKPAKNKKAKAVLSAEKSKLGPIETSIGDAKSALASGDVLGARTKIDAATAELAALKSPPAAPEQKPAKAAKAKAKAKKHRR
jgi:hypothetical protein